MEIREIVLAITIIPIAIFITYEILKSLSDMDSSFFNTAALIFGAILFGVIILFRNLSKS